MKAAHAGISAPLGSGVVGCPFSIDRESVRAELGFDQSAKILLTQCRPGLDLILYAGAMVGVHLSRLSEDLVLFSNVEFGFIRISDGFSTRSSLMPQKRNPDVAELGRGKTGRLIGNLMSILTLLKGLPTSYNRDLQEDKEPLFDTIDTLSLTLPALTGAVSTASFCPERMAEVMDVQLLATDLADYLVRRGVPFRTTHEVVGRLVRTAEEKGVALFELGLEAFIPRTRSLKKTFLTFSTGSVCRGASCTWWYRARVGRPQLRDVRAQIEGFRFRKSDT